MRFTSMLLTVVATLQLGCGPGVEAPVYTRADRFTLYSIDGTNEVAAGAPDDETHFHGYPILGQVDLDAADRQVLIEALYQGIAASDGTAAGCFIPRHALRVVEGKEITDYVICFQCLTVQVYSKGKLAYELTTEGPRAAFNRYLGQAGIPLAP